MSVWISTDGGTVFNGRPIPGTETGYVDAIAVNPLDDRTIYIGGFLSPGGRSEPALFRTTDGGATWEDIVGTFGSSSISTIEVDPVNPNIVFVQHFTSVFKSENGGSTWRDVSPLGGVWAFRVNPESPQELYALAESGLIQSLDGGWTWNSIGGQLDLPYVRGLEILRGIKMVYAWTYSGGIYRNRLSSLYAVSVAAGRGGTTDPSPGVYPTEAGATLNIAAVPLAGYRFKDWTGDRSGTANPLRITVDSDIAVQANFQLAAPTGFTVVRQEARSLLRVQYLNVLSWTRITGVPDVAGYRIYLMTGGTRARLAEVDSLTSTYWHRGVSKAGTYQYALVAIDSEGNEGDVVLSTKGTVVTKRGLADRLKRR